MIKRLVALSIVFFSSLAYSGDKVDTVIAVQQAKLQEQTKAMQGLQSELAELKKKLNVVESNFLSKTDAEKTYAKPGRSVGINLSNCTEDYNFVDLGTEHRLSSYQCSPGKVSIGVRHYGAAGRVDRVYCCSLSGSIQ